MLLQRLVWIPVQHGEATSRESCAYLAPDLCSKQTLLRKNNLIKQKIISLYVSYTLPETYLFKFDSRKAPFRLGNAVLGIKLLYVGYTKHLPYLVKFDSCKARFFWLGNAVLGIKLLYVSYTLLLPSLEI